MITINDATPFFNPNQQNALFARFDQGAETLYTAKDGDKAKHASFVHWNNLLDQAAIDVKNVDIRQSSEKGKFVEAWNRGNALLQDRDKVRNAVETDQAYFFKPSSDKLAQGMKPDPNDTSPNAIDVNDSPEVGLLNGLAFEAQEETLPMLEPNEDNTFENDSFNFGSVEPPALTDAFADEFVGGIKNETPPAPSGELNFSEFQSEGYLPEI
jgi:hypothetical protein